MCERRWIVAGCLCVMLAGCGGGSGSTGLATSEDAVIDQVRRDGTCDEFDGTPYCATDSPDATPPGGQSVSIVTAVPTAAPTSAPTPATTGTPAANGSATPQAAPTSTPSSGGGPTPAPPSATMPEPTATPAEPTATLPLPTATPPDQGMVTAVVDGFDAGAACATAARPAASDEEWRTATLVPVAGAGAPTTFPLPTGVPAPLDLALLCFTDPPATLPPTLVTLADAAPTVVFVLPSP
jgi:hypothetical protein